MKDYFDMKNMSDLKTSKQYNLLSASLAFFIWGGWSFYINDASIFSRVTSGLAQGISSFIITLIMVKIVTWFYYRIYFKQLRFILPAMATVFCTGSVLITIHYLIGTPYILKTVTPALSVAFIFCLYTSYKLKYQ